MDITISAIILCLESQLSKVREHLAALKSQEKTIERLIEKVSSGQIGVAEVLAALFAGEVTLAPEILRTRKRGATTVLESETETANTHSEVAGSGEVCSKTREAKNGKTSKVLQFVTEHPGTTSEDIFAWCASQGVYENNDTDRICLSALLSCQKSKRKLFSKPEPGKKWHRYYPDEATMTAGIISNCEETEESKQASDQTAESIASATETLVTPRQELEQSSDNAKAQATVINPPIEEEPINPPCPRTYLPGSLNGDLFKIIWEADGLTMDEIRQSIRKSSWGNSAAGNIHKNVDAMRKHGHIIRERQKRPGVTVEVYKATSKDAAISKIMWDRREAKAKETPASSDSGKSSDDEASDTGDQRPHKNHPPPSKLKIPGGQDDWSPAVIWLIKRLRYKFGVVEFDVLCERAKTELVDFGWNLSTTSSTVIENGIRKVVLELQENGRICMDSSGVIFMPSSDDDEVEQEPEEGDSNDDHEDLKILLAVDGDEEVIPQEESPFIPSASHTPVSSPAVEAEVVRRQLSLWYGKKQLNQAVRDMCEIIRELMLDRDDFDNATDIANAFYEEGSKSFDYDPQVSFKKLEALARLSLKQMIARKEVCRDWEDFLVLTNPEP